MVENNFAKFKETWEEEIRKIENEVLDHNGSWLIYYRFEMDWLILENYYINIDEFGDEFGDVYLEKNLLESKLTRALEIARTKYKLQSHSLWIRLIESSRDIIESSRDIIRGVPKPKGIDPELLRARGEK